MYRFLIHTFSAAWPRNIGIVCSSILSSIILCILFFSYQNIVEGVSYYTLRGIEENRVTITQSANILQLLDRDIGGISPDIVEKIRNDPDISSYKIFRFIDVPVLGTFRIFQFGLTVDVPVFSLETREDILKGIGISRSMLDYYNIQLSGSHPFFPRFEEADILGKDVQLQFGVSKLFSLSGAERSTYSAQIDQIDPDFPGFGIIVPHRVALSAMKRIGHTVSQPYRIVIRLRTLSDRTLIEKRYQDLILHFDYDTIQEETKSFQKIAQIVIVIGSIMLSSIVGLLILLFLGYFREKSSVFELARLYYIGRVGRFLLILIEPIAILLLSSVIAFLSILFLEKISLPIMQGFLHENGFIFRLASLQTGDIGLLIFSNLILTLSIILLIYMKKR